MRLSALSRVNSFAYLFARGFSNKINKANLKPYIRMRNKFMFHLLMTQARSSHNQIILLP